jgi:hypothetical protein
LFEELIWRVWLGRWIQVDMFTSMWLGKGECSEMEFRELIWGSFEFIGL